METNERQSELFQEFNVSAKKPKLKREIVFKPILGNRKVSLSTELIIIIAISVIMLNIVSFAIGIERGKKNLQEDQISQLPQIIPEVTLSKDIQEPEVPPKSETKPEPTSKGQFTIQVASFKSKDLAQKEVDKLKSKGYTALFQNTQKYFSVCVGKFSSNTEAKKSLESLRKSYKDCFIKKL